ncbi:MAG: Mu transposase C-terminal domain-containing protein [Gammaproteobacteria bacterium]
MVLKIQPGVIVTFNGQRYKIKSPLNLERVLIEPLGSGEAISALLSNLQPATPDNRQSSEKTHGARAIIEFKEKDWAEAKKREKLIRPLATTICSREDARKIGAKLGISSRYVYKLIKRYQESDCKLTSLLPSKRNGGAGKGRINKEIEKIIQASINEFYLTRQKFRISVVVQEVLRRCHYSNLKMPSDRTVRRRIECVQAKHALMKREGAKVAREEYSPIIGSFPEVKQPLAVLQIDHTPVDLIIVDEFHRKPIGRPYLTVAIDVFSRCITGFCLSLEAPSAVSVGLCLSHSIFDKDTWLSDRKINTSWPIWGKPDVIYVDNASEFHSEALQRGCDAHGIQIKYRPIAQPHFGGIVERVIGTMMQHIHQLPGTTFSNIAERGDYPSEKKAVLTLAELEQWLTISITDYYHQKIHSGISLPPIEKYKAGILGDESHKGCGYFPRIQNKKLFLIDFLPIERRTLQRHGFMLDHITYYSNALSPMIANRKKYGPFIIRRDPRDISHIYILDPESHTYLEIPYRTLSRPTVTLWEHRQALNFLREKGIEKKDETLIFQAVEKLREITKEATKRSKSARRQHERTHQAQMMITTPIQEQFEQYASKTGSTQPARPFEDIEIW